MKMGLSFDIKEIEEMAKAAPEIVREEVEAVLKLIAYRLEKEVMEKTPKGVGGAGGLQGNIHGEVVQYGKSLAAVVGTPVQYGEVIEIGRKANSTKPPVEPIARWAQVMLGLSEKDAEAAAEKIAWHIKWHGFKGQFMFYSTFKKLEFWISQQVATIPERIAERLKNGPR
jgi:hypothetical protein